MNVGLQGNSVVAASEEGSTDSLDSCQSGEPVAAPTLNSGDGDGEDPAPTMLSTNGGGSGAGGGVSSDPENSNASILSLADDDSTVDAPSEPPSEMDEDSQPPVVLNSEEPLAKKIKVDG